jgi:hypothetical protein
MKTIWILYCETTTEDFGPRVETEILGAYEAESDAVHAKTLCELGIKEDKETLVAYYVASMPLNPKTPTWD